MVFPRKMYLQKLVAGMQNNMVKIVTGIRRCGKSYLLFNIFKEYLLSHGTDEAHIIGLSLDNIRNRRLFVTAMWRLHRGRWAHLTELSKGSTSCSFLQPTDQFYPKTTHFHEKVHFFAFFLTRLTSGVSPILYFCTVKRESGSPTDANGVHPVGRAAHIRVTSLKRGFEAFTRIVTAK